MIVGDNMKKIVIILISIFIILLVCFCSISFKLLGKISIILDVNQGEYEESGYELKIFIFNLNNKVKIEGEVDTTKVGEYHITYKFLNRRLERVISVKDYESPEIKLKGDSKVVLYQGETYEELGYEVIDN